jgi:CheY-like chemotaxis protein
MDDGILIIEDEAIIALDIARMVRLLGYSVSGLAGDEQEALFLAEKKRPALALVDIKLKGGADGIEVARKLKGQSIPFIFITAYSDSTVRERAMKLQPSGYLLKPINKEEFRKAIKLVMPER